MPRNLSFVGVLILLSSTVLQAADLRERALQSAREMRPISSASADNVDSHLSLTLELILPPSNGQRATGFKLHLEKIEDSLAIVMLSRSAMPYAIINDGKAIVISTDEALNDLRLYARMAFSVHWTTDRPLLVKYLPDSRQNELNIDLASLIEEILNDREAKITIDEFNRRLTVERPEKPAMAIEFAADPSAGWYGIDRVFVNYPDGQGVVLSNVRRGCRRLDYGCTELTVARRLLETPAASGLPPIDNVTDETVKRLLSPELFVALEHDTATLSRCHKLHQLVAAQFPIATKRLIEAVDRFVDLVEQPAVEIAVAEKALDELERNLADGFLHEIATQSVVPLKCDFVRYSRFASADSLTLVLGGVRAARLDEALLRLAHADRNSPARAIRCIGIISQLGPIRGAISIVSWQARLRNSEKEVTQALVLARGILQYSRPSDQEELATIDNAKESLTILLAERAALGGISLDQDALPGMVQAACRAKPLTARRLLRALMYVPAARPELAKALLHGDCPDNCLPDLAASAALTVAWQGSASRQVISHIEQRMPDERLPEALRTTCIALLAGEIQDPKVINTLTSDFFAGKQYATTTLMSLSSDRLATVIQACEGATVFVSKCPDRTKRELAACLRLSAASNHKLAGEAKGLITVLMQDNDTFITRDCAAALRLSGIRR